MASLHAVKIEAAAQKLATLALAAGLTWDKSTDVDLEKVASEAGLEYGTDHEDVLIGALDKMMPAIDIEAAAKKAAIWVVKDHLPDWSRGETLDSEMFSYCTRLDNLLTGVSATLPELEDRYFGVEIAEEVAKAARPMVRGILREMFKARREEQKRAADAIKARVAALLKAA